MNFAAFGCCNPCFLQIYVLFSIYVMLTYLQDKKKKHFHVKFFIFIVYTGTRINRTISCSKVYMFWLYICYLLD